ncbi:MAG TPA: hypothetical protein PLP25_00185 [Candidatus Limiplasma sp.]|nr:hypothetical protein [Candidatus Limiplasma sp.]HPS80259.1 hypothetical protein [Candidatus Limiplasma sp.]
MGADSRVIFSTELDDSGVKAGLNGMKTSVSGLGAGIGAALGTLGAGILSGIASSAGAMISGAISAASDLQEVQNVVDTTFEGSAGRVNKWAESAKDAYGMGELAAKRYSSTMGAMFKSMGLASDATLDMSLGIAGLTGDMASFYNLDYDTAFDKLRSGISGETEPLKQLGINMSVANLSAYALSKGITKSYDSMTQAEQTTLRYNYLMQVTSDAQGDFARTSEGYANQQRVLQTTQEELSAAIGELLLPAAIAGTNALNGLVGGLTSSIKGISEFFNPPKSELQSQIDDANTAVKNFNDSLKNADTNLTVSLESAKETKATALSLLDSYEKIRNKSVLTEEDTAQLQTIAKQIVALYPDMGSAIDATTGLFNANTTAVRDNIKSLADQQAAMAYYSATQDYQKALLDATIAESKAAAAHQAAYDDWIKKDAQVKALNGMYTSIQSNAGAIEEFAGQLISLNPAFKQYFDITKNGTYVLNQNGKAAFGTGSLYTLLEDVIGQYSESASIANENTVKLNDTWIETQYTSSDAADSLKDAKEAVSNLGDAFVAPTTAMSSYTNATSTATTATATETAETEKLRASLLKLSTDTLTQIDAQIEGFEKIGKVRPKSAKQTTKDTNSQTQFLEDYIANFNKAKENGVTPEALSELTEVNEKNAAVLAGLAKGSDKTITDFNTAYSDRVKASTDLATTLVTFKTELEATNKTLTDGTMEGSTAVSDAATGVSTNLTQAATDSKTAVDTVATTGTALKTSIDGMTTIVSEKAETLATVGTGIADSAASGITDSTSIKDALSASVAGAIETSQTDNQDDAKLLGGAIVTKTAAGVTANTQIRAALSSRVLIAINGSYLDNAASAKSIGSALVNAISSGVVAQGWALNATIKQIVMDALNAAKLAAGLPVDSDKSSGVTSAINAGKSALDNTLLGRVQSAMLSGGYYPSASQLSASVLRNSAAGIYNTQYASSAQAKNINIEQKMYFGDNIQTPDEIARAVKRQTLVGLAGGKA